MALKPYGEDQVGVEEGQWLAAHVTAGPIRAGSLSYFFGSRLWVSMKSDGDKGEVRKNGRGCVHWERCHVSPLHPPRCHVCVLVCTPEGKCAWCAHGARVWRGVGGRFRGL